MFSIKCLGCGAVYYAVHNGHKYNLSVVSEILTGAIKHYIRGNWRIIVRHLGLGSDRVVLTRFIYRACSPTQGTLWQAI